MHRPAFASPLALSSFVLLALGSVGCLNRASFETDLKSAPLAQNPFTVAPELAQAPPTVNNRQGDSFRITLADRKEVCVSGQTSDTAARVKDSTFVLEAFASPNDQGRLATVKSSRIRIIQDTERSTNRGTVEPVTVFEACFANKNVFTADTEYLTMQPEMQHVANKLFVAWHFTKEAVQVKHEFSPTHSWDGRTSPSIEALHRMPQKAPETVRFEDSVVNPYSRVMPGSAF
ncbi:hypothetical protein LVJ94_21905 [Pendulispora rubella]|uniref:Lipoprotein n=1 Tax=Pendulispora rubella TaxID=2741070 RepID=A0ABZ2LL46_9BACT